MLVKAGAGRTSWPGWGANANSYLTALGNQYCPSFYLVDKKGNIRARFVGETHAGDRNALAVESAITALMAEH